MPTGVWGVGWRALVQPSMCVCAGWGGSSLRRIGVVAGLGEHMSWPIAMRRQMDRQPAMTARIISIIPL